MQWPPWKESPEPSDQSLVETFLEQRDEGTFRCLYRRHARQLYSLAYRLSDGNREEAEEIVQAAWLRAVERLGGFRGESSLRSWLAGFVVNCARETWRHRGRRPSLALSFTEPMELDEDLASAPSRPSDSDVSDRRRRLERALFALPLGYREVLILHDFEGYTHLEIGQLLGIEAGTSKSQLFRARRAIRALLGEQGVVAL